MVEIELTETIKATPAAVWPVVANVLRQSDYVAHSITETRQTNVGELGLEFRWHEQGVLLGRPYECDCQFFGWEPQQWVCFGTEKLFHVSFELEATEDGGTLVSYRCELPVTRDARREALIAICRESLRNLKRLIEQGGE